MKVRDLIKKIEDAGWEFKRMRGSHRIFERKGDILKIAVAGKPGDDVPTGTLHKILKDAGVKK